MKFETARTLVRSAGAARRRAAGPGMLEALEPRRLLTAYTYQPVAEAFDLDRFVREVAPPEAGLEGFGARVAGLGDVDGDGADDFAVSAPGARGTGLSDPWTGPGGKVFVYSGRTAGLIRTLSDGAAGFGAALVNAGDADGDGVADLAVGSPMFAGGAGRVTIYSGADGAVVRAYDGAAAGDGLGWAVANVTDVNLDGVDDLIIGAPGAGAGDEPGAGRAYVYSSADGFLLWTFAGEAPGDRFGFAVAGGVDVPVLESANGDDGAKEFFVGAPGHDVEGTGPEAGRAYAIDGATGAVRFTFSGENAGDQFGHSVLMVGGSAINRDFLFRWVVGVPGFDAPHFDPVTFEQLGTFEDGGRIERFLARGFDDVNEPLLLGDDDGARFGTDAFFVGEVYTFFAEDDVQEYAVTAPGAAAPANRLRLFNGNVTNGITGFPGTPAEGVSWAAVAGDADGDGISDFVVSFPPSGGANGSVRIVPFTLVTEPPSIRAASDSGRYIVLASTSGAEGAATPGYVVIDGRLTSLPSFAGLLPGDQILAVNDEGLFFGLGALETGAATAEHYFFLFNGVRTRLSDAVATVSGAAPSSLSFAGMNNTGDVIFNGVLPGPGGQAQSPYLFRGGVLRQLWNGVVGGINDSGVIVGTRDPRA